MRASNRTAIGLAVNLPQFRYVDTYQVQNNVTMVRGNHLIKAGVDLRREYVKSFFLPTIRGLIRYATLDAFVNDVAEATNINKPLPGGADVVLLPLVGSGTTLPRTTGDSARTSRSTSASGTSCLATTFRAWST